MPTLFDPLKLGALDSAQPHRDGAADPLPRASRHPRAQRPGGGILPPARRRGLDHFRSDHGHRRWASAMPPRRASGRTNRPKAGRRSPAPCMTRAGACCCSSGMWAAFPIRCSWMARCRKRPARCGPRAMSAWCGRKRNSSRPAPWRRDEIPGVIAAFKRGAENAKRAGFDGVEIHGANGYLLDQFLQDSTNHRTDAYGGTRENRARLMLEVADACIEVWGADRVGMHLAPRMDSHDMGDSDRLGPPSPTSRANWASAGSAFLLREARETPRDSQGNSNRSAAHQGSAFGGVYIANEGFTCESANSALAEGMADAVAFGKLFIANPDLPQRFAGQARRSMNGTARPSIPAARRAISTIRRARSNLPEFRHLSGNHNQERFRTVAVLLSGFGHHMARRIDMKHFAKIAAARRDWRWAPAPLPPWRTPAAVIPTRPEPCWAPAGGALDRRSGLAQRGRRRGRRRGGRLCRQRDRAQLGLRSSRGTVPALSRT